MELKHITINKTARYAQLGTLSEHTKTIWIVFHGYGHLAEHFIKKFKMLDDDETVIIAPEALSKFYLEGFSGRVGASWMTKEDRLNEIEDYLNFIDKIYQELGLNGKEIAIHLIGFSQGTNTASRVYFLGKNRVDNLFLIAGSVPDDIPKEVLLNRLNGKELVLLSGEDDTLIPTDLMYKEHNRLREIGVRINHQVFKGEHTVNEDCLSKILDILSKEVK